MLHEKLKRKHSVSSLELFQSCQYKYYLKYILGNYSKQNQIHLEIGTFVHKALEDFMQSKDLKLTIDKLKAKAKEFMEYKPKFKILKERLENGDLYNGYTVIATEKDFEITINNEIFKGSIDLVLKDENDNIVIVDYKTSKKIFEKKKLDNSLQVMIYSYAVKQLYDKHPSEFIFDFVFLDRKQFISNNLDNDQKLLDTIKDIFIQMNKCYDNDEFIPNKSVLCSFCDYSSQTGCEDSCTGLCEWEMFYDKETRKIKKGKIFVPKSSDEVDEWRM